jgi:hypothetical protein
VGTAAEREQVEVEALVDAIEKVCALAIAVERIDRAAGRKVVDEWSRSFYRKRSTAPP